MRRTVMVLVAVLALMFGSASVAVGADHNRPEGNDNSPCAEDHPGAASEKNPHCTGEGPPGHQRDNRETDTVEAEQDVGEAEEDAAEDEGGDEVADEDGDDDAAEDDGGDEVAEEDGDDDAAEDEGGDEVAEEDGDDDAAEDEGGDADTDEEAGDDDAEAGDEVAGDPEEEIGEETGRISFANFLTMFEELLSIFDGQAA